MTQQEPVFSARHWAAKSEKSAMNAEANAGTAQTCVQECEDLAALLGNPAASDLSNVHSVAAQSAAASKADLTTKAQINLSNVSEISSGSVVAKKDLSNITLSGKTLSAGWCMPDYSAGISVPSNANYAAPSAGVIISYTLSAYGGDNYTSIKINGIIVSKDVASYAGSRSSLFAMVSSGETAYIEVPNTTGRVNTFYPMKGAI